MLANNNLIGALPPELGQLRELRHLYLYRNGGLRGALPAEMARIRNLGAFYAFATGLTVPSSLAGWYAAIAIKSSLPAARDDAVGFGDRTIAGRCYTEGVPRSDLVLPAATGGVGAVTYSLSPAPPPGLRFDPATRTLSGTLGDQGWTTSERSYFYTARDAAGDTATLSFTIMTVKGAADRQALVAIYNATGGPNWAGAGDWLSHCAPIDRWRGVSTGLDGRVTALDLSGMRLAGKLPAELADLDALETLDLSQNRLTGTIPPALGSLSRLGELNLAGNILTGSIPAALGNPDRLQALNLSGNRLTGAIPSALGRLSRLETLDLSENRLSGALPASLGTLAALRSLDLRNTGVFGYLPASLTNLRLRTFRTAGTALCLPEDMIDWYLDIDRHDYMDFKEVPGGRVEYSPKQSCRGQLSFEGRTVGDKTYEERSGLSGTPIASVTLPEASGGAGEIEYTLTPALPPGLSFDPVTRVLSGTPTRAQPATVYTYTARDTGGRTSSLSFTITVTEQAAPPPPPPGSPSSDRAALIALYKATWGGTDWSASWFGRNWLSERPLDEWEGVKTDAGGRVVELRLVGGELSGIGKSGALVGHIPSELASLSRLRVLDLHRNTLVDTIPPELGNLPNLVKLDLSQNSLTGSIPPSLGNLSSLEELNLYENGLTGSIPPELGNLSNLKVLNLGYNELSGPVPSELGNLSSLEVLQLRENMLTGEVPSSFVNLKRLKRRHFSWDQDGSRWGTGLCISRSLYYEIWPSARPPGKLPVLGPEFCEDRSQSQASSSPLSVNANARQQAYRATRDAIETTLDASAAALLSSAAAYVDRRIGSGGVTSAVIGGEAVPLHRPGASIGDAVETLTDRREGISREPWGMDWDAFLRSSSFELAFGPDRTRGGARLTLSGHSAVSRFGHADRDTIRSGTLRIGWLGLDARLGGGWRTGIAASRSEMDIAYTPRDGGSRGRIGMTLNGVYPWARFAPGGRSEIWALAGTADGEIRNRPADEADPADAGVGPVSARLVLTGGRWSFFPDGPFDLALTGDAGMARIETAGGASLVDGLAGEAWRSRIGAEASWTASPGGGLETTPFVEVAGRHDGGRETRQGIEAAGGLKVAKPSLGLDLEARGRMLSLHSAAGHREWGASLTARLRPRGGTGLALSFAPRWGVSTEEAGELWRDDVFGLAGSGTPQAADAVALDTRAEYGVAARVGTLTPFGEFGLRDADDRRLRVGVRLTAGDAAGRALDLEFAGERHDRGGRETEHGVSLTGRLNF